MRFKIFYLACLGLITAVPVISQTRTVINADLEKYRQQRLKAEREYNENYAKLGFPSPEELQKQMERSRVEREALAARLAAERIQREQAEAAREAARQSEPDIYILQGSGAGSRYFYGFPNSYFFRRRFRIAGPFSPPITGGNGIPIIDYYGRPFFHRPQPAIRMARP